MKEFGGIVCGDLIDIFNYVISHDFMTPVGFFFTNYVLS